MLVMILVIMSCFLLVVLMVVMKFLLFYVLIWFGWWIKGVFGCCFIIFGMIGLLGFLLKFVVRIVGSLKNLLMLVSVIMLFLKLLGEKFWMSEMSLDWWLINNNVVWFLLRCMYFLVMEYCFLDDLVWKIF